MAVRDKLPSSEIFSYIIKLYRTFQANTNIGYKQKVDYRQILIFV